MPSVLSVVTGADGAHLCQVSRRHDSLRRAYSYNPRVHIRFSPLVLALYALQLAPNLVWIAAPPANNVLATNRSKIPVLNWIEVVFGISTVALLIVSVNAGETKSGHLFIALAVLFLAAYYISWILYYRGMVSPWLLIIGMAATPPLYFLCLGLWMQNYVVVVPCVIFGVTHVAITSDNYLRAS